jgi:hypothetical protein
MPPCTTRFPDAKLYGMLYAYQAGPETAVLDH